MMKRHMKSEKTSKRIALIYCRVSSDRQKNEGHGLDSQEHRCRDYARFNDYEVEEVFRDSFTGGGDFMKRPAMSELLRYLDNHLHKQYVVIFDDLKRFARDKRFHWDLRAAFKSRNTPVECLNFKFEDTPEGEFVEAIFAAQGELEREQNKRQVIQKQKARLEAGYWSFYPPPGYKSVKEPGHGKLLVIDEPRASIIREAFEGYANDRFLEQIDVLKFLQDCNYADGKPVYLGSVRRILIRAIYAGYIEYPDWEVSRRRGHHEAIISLETFEKVQDKLNGKALVRTRKDFSEVFPLRGFASCAKCREPFTGSESTGKKGKKHPYYRCRNRQCSESTKSIKKSDLETAFLEQLRMTQPSQKVIDLAKAVIEDLYHQRKSEVGKKIQRIDREVAAIDVEIGSLVVQVAKTEKRAVIEIYEQKIEELSKRKEEAQKKKGHVELGPVSVGTAFDAVMEYLKNPEELWVNGDLDDKRRVLKLVFAERFTYDREKSVGTAKLSILYELFQHFRDHKYQDVEMAGIEPASEKLHARDSTVSRPLFDLSDHRQK